MKVTKVTQDEFDAANGVKLTRQVLDLAEVGEDNYGVRMSELKEKGRFNAVTFAREDEDSKHCFLIADAKLDEAKAEMLRQVQELHPEWQGAEFEWEPNPLLNLLVGLAED
jgi:hypothetical protein